MIDDKDFSGRKLTDVFKELEQARYSYEQENRANERALRAKKEKKKKKVHNLNNQTIPENINNQVNMENPEIMFSNKKAKISKKAIPISGGILALLVVTSIGIVTFSNSVMSKDSLASSDVASYAGEEDVDIEINRHRLNAHNIITSNSALETVKEQVTEERDIPFETVYQDCSYLPKDEQTTIQNGEVGKKNVTVVKTYENGEFVEENILNETKTKDYLPQIVTVGTSEFLAKIKAHLNDTLYLTSDSVLRKETKDDSEEVAKIEKYIDVKLLELPSEEWCKVSYDSVEGYLPTSVLTSAVVTPSMPEKNRIKKILDKVNIEMELNKPSGLTLADYKKVFKNLPNDTNNIFEDNAEVFYEVEKKYNINGIFLASLGIHESNWGTSQIAKDKKNLFGYGSYDSTPYESSYEFETYEEGIDLVARVLTKYYINPPGTKIYNNETAVSTYYNGSTLEAVNERYASDEDWHTKVFNYMEYLYNRL